MTSCKRRWYLTDITHVSWPGSLPWRGQDVAARGGGYASEDEAWQRANVINRHYNATTGQGGPDLRVKLASCEPRRRRR